METKGYNHDMPCSGFYICKINTKVKEFFSIWYNTNCSHDQIHPWEQTALWKLISMHNYDANLYIIDSWMFLEQENQFLRHIGSLEQHNRVPYFKSFIKLKNIDYEKNIKKKVIDYDTNEYINNNLSIQI